MYQQTQFERSPQFTVKCFILIICFIIGLLGFFFCVWKENYYASAGFIIMEAASASILELNVRHMRGQLFPKYTRGKLQILLYSDVFLFFVTVIYCIFLIVMGVNFETEFSFLGDNAYFALIPAIVAALLDALLLYEVRNFIKLYDAQYGGSSNIQ